MAAILFWSQCVEVAGFNFVYNKNTILTVDNEPSSRCGPADPEGIHHQQVFIAKHDHVPWPLSR